jgi:hypothetical protein
MLRIGLGDDRRRHVEGAVLLVQATGDLDLLHLLARRHLDSEDTLDATLLLLSRRHEVDPDRLRG